MPTGVNKELNGVILRGCQSRPHCPHHDLSAPQDPGVKGHHPGSRGTMAANTRRAQSETDSGPGGRRQLLYVCFSLSHLVPQMLKCGNLSAHDPWIRAGPQGDRAGPAARFHSLPGVTYILPLWLILLFLRSVCVCMTVSKPPRCFISPSDFISSERLQAETLRPRLHPQQTPQHFVMDVHENCQVFTALLCCHCSSLRRVNGPHHVFSTDVDLQRDLDPQTRAGFTNRQTRPGPTD